MFELQNSNETKKISTFLPNKEFVLITGKIEVLGMELFCGSVVHNDKDGVHFAPCEIITPDPILYTKIDESLVGTIVKIDKKRIPKAKHLKNDFTVSKTVEIKTLKPQIEEKINEFNSNSKPFFEDNKIII